VVRLLWSWRWPLGVGALLLVAVVVVRWANTRPGYDPYGWLVWGHLTIHGKLDTNGAPSWKPLPFLFTVPYALAGLTAMWLWAITAVAISLSGLVFAARIAYRLTGASGRDRYAGYIAGACAAAFLWGINGYTHYVLSAQSDTMIVSLCLGAIDCTMNRRYKWAFVLMTLAGLGRPEAWPLIGVYAIWAWRSHPSMRPLLAFGLLLQPLLWFGIPALTSKSWFTAGNIALKSPRALHENKLLGELGRFTRLTETSVYLASLVTIAYGLLKRDRTILLIIGAALLWVIVEVAFVLHGWPGVARYLFEPGAVMTVLAGAGIGLLLLELPKLSRRLKLRVSPLVGTLAAAVLIAAVLIPLVPAARNRIDVERADLKLQRERTKMVNHLPGLIAQLGGAKKLFYCGKPTSGIGWQSVLAWELGVNVGELFWTPHLNQVHHDPVVLFRDMPGAWKVVPMNIPFAKRATCDKLRVTSTV
jgi:hypothetical protein